MERAEPAIQKPSALSSASALKFSAASIELGALKVEVAAKEMAVAIGHDGVSPIPKRRHRRGSASALEAASLEGQARDQRLALVP